MAGSTDSQIVNEAPPGPPPERRSGGDVVDRTLPWTVSLLLHLGLVLLTIFLVWSLVEPREDPVLPSARLTDDPGGQRAETQSLDLEAIRPQRQVQTERMSTEQTLQELHFEDRMDLDLLGLADGGGDLPPFGGEAGTGEGLRAEFFGVGGNARRLIYLVDASGSMIDTMPFVIQELQDQIGRLSEQQEFTVVFFQAGEPLEPPPEGWKRADGATKRSVSGWIALEEGNVTPRGTTDPQAALERAMSYGPELIFLLSDNITGRGRYEVDRRHLLSALAQANSRRRTTINTIQFVYPDPLGTLEQIADAHGGVHTFVSESDLGLR